MKEHHISQQGFTLVEVIIALAFSSLVMSGFLLLFWTTGSVYKWGITSGDIQYSARRAISDIVKDVKEATTVTIRDDGELVLNEATKHEIRYINNQGNLLRIVPQNSIPIAENIDKLEFDKSANGLLLISVEVSSNGIRYSLSTFVFPRTAQP